MRVPRRPAAHFLLDFCYILKVTELFFSRISPNNRTVVDIPKIAPATRFAFSLAIYSKARATVESKIADACNAIGDGNARKARATAESIMTYACNAIGYGNARKALATLESIMTDACNAIGNDKLCYKLSVKI